MNIYRYKNYDFEKDMLPLGFEWKEPQIIMDSQPEDLDYVIYDDKEYLIEVLKDKYIINAEKGSDYVYVMTAKINLNIQTGIITLKQGTDYATQGGPVINDLKKGYWHTAYYYHIAIQPEEELIDLHNEIKEYIKNYVNTTYTEAFRIE